MSGMPVASFLAGFWVGLAVAAPLGPMGMLCIQRTLASGMMAGLGTGLAAATVQVSYGTMALLGLGPLLLAIAGAGANVLSAASGAILLWFAFKTARAPAPVPVGAPPAATGLLRSFRDALALGFSNPMAVALFLAASPALGGPERGSEGWIVVAGIFAGAIGWYASLSGAVSFSRHWLSARNLTVTRRLSAAILTAFAAYMFSQALGMRA